MRFKVCIGEEPFIAYLQVEMRQYETRGDEMK